MTFGGQENQVRFDLSDSLFHFVRAIDLRDEDAPPLPEEWPSGVVVEDYVLSPFFLLRQIARTGRLVPTWAYRGPRRTIYGTRPAVCFTEMPLAAFLMAGRERSERGEKMSDYGLVISKEQLFGMGARPAIYGLDKSASYSSSGGYGSARQLGEDVLPTREQFRYLAFDPTQGGRLDWSHEREWRWPTQDELPRVETYNGLFRHGLELGKMEGLGFIVKTARQAKELLQDVLWHVDSGKINADAVSYILVREHLPEPTKLIPPSEVAAAFEQGRIDIAPFLSVDNAEFQRVSDKFDALVEKVADTIDIANIRAGKLGKCWLWLRDNTSNLARAMISRPFERGVEINDKGYCLVNVPEFRDDTGLRLREELVEKLAGLVENEFDTPATYFSVQFSDDPDHPQFYWGLRSQRGPHRCLAHRADDF